MISKQPIVYWISQCRVGYRIYSRSSLSWSLQLYPHIPTLRVCPPNFPNHDSLSYHFSDSVSQNSED